MEVARSATRDDLFVADARGVAPAADGAAGAASMVKAPSLAGQSSPSQPPHMEAFGPRLRYTLWRSHGATPLALRG